MSEKLLEIPDKQTVKGYVIVLALMVNIYNPLMVYFLQHNVLKYNIMNYYLIAMAFIDLLSLMIYIFPDKFSKLLYFYASFIFVGSSILFLIIADITIYLEADVNTTLFIISTILVYVLILLIVGLNFRRKINIKSMKRSKLRYSGAIPFIGAAIGAYMGRHINFGTSNITLAIIILISSYFLALTSSGFYRTIMIYNKAKINNK